jgi:hypothetical protein
MTQPKGGYLSSILGQNASSFNYKTQPGLDSSNDQEGFAE